MLLFQSINIGGMQLKNRIAMPAVHHAYAPEGYINERLIKYYETRAMGGAALITVGGCSVDTLGLGPQMIGLHDDRFLEGLAALAAAVKNAGAKIAAQLYHSGRYTHSALTGQKPIAPSPIASRLTREEPHEMTAQDIDEVIENFAAAALRAKMAGFDAVEVIASAGYLICQFLSPLTNHRTDEYGGSFDHRCRFGAEVISRVRERVGPDFPLIVRISGHDFMPGGNTNREASLFAAKLQEAGADAFNVTGGWHETRVPQITGHLPRGGLAYLARGIKEAVQVPVMASNRINDPQTAERILRDKLADMVNLGRPLIADPLFPEKTRRGETARIRRCIACNQGCLDMIFSFQDVHCTVNPLAGREHEITVTPAAAPRRVLVIGGGPAGLEAARTAASRGHRVTLWEKEPVLGGQILHAAVPPGKSEFATLVDYYRAEMAAMGVKVMTGREANAEAVLAENFDVVVVATGAEPLPAPFPVEEGAPLAYARQVLAGEVSPGQEVVVVGGGSVGCETAVYIAGLGVPDAAALKFLLEHEAETPEALQQLVKRGTRKVTVVELLKGFARDMGVSTRWIMAADLRRLGVRVLDRTPVKEITARGVYVEKDGGEVLLPADTVVLAVGARPNNRLAEELSGKVPELHVIGDALRPRKLTEAIREGFETALKI